MICQECFMDVPDNEDGTTSFHPYLHCWIFRSWGMDPVTFLARYGYVHRDTLKEALNQAPVHSLVTNQDVEDLFQAILSKAGVEETS